MNKQLKKYIQYALDHGAGEAELYCQEQQEDSIEVRNQKVEKLQHAVDRGLAVRVICKQKLGFSYTTSLAEEDVLKTIDNAITSAQYTGADEFWSMPKPARRKKTPPLKLFDRAITKLTAAERLRLAKQLERTGYAYDNRIKKTESASFSTGITQSWLLNSHGVSSEEQRTYCGAALEVIASAKGQMEAGADYQFTASLNELKIKTIAETAAEKAVLMLGAGDIQTGVYDLLLPAEVSINFLSIILPMILADNIQNNKSLLKEKLGQQIASKIVTILDDALLPQGLGSFILDAEGVPGQTKIIVQNGILKKFLYDTYTANKGKTVSTGNAVRHSLKGEPGLGASNFYLKPGKQTRTELLRSIKKGLLIHNVMGLHTADPISGQFSLGAVGELIENGKITRAVKNIAIAGNLLELLQNISGIGKDIQFAPADGAIGAPSLVINNIKAAGKN